ncbi:DUF2177 family protein [Neotabrizicola shimadae]|uniref:DUF2177 family protein n=1 Tax=Neotabrizicola shimadae TaxID=2807096 RepID=A0A8G1EAG3_9RHOB|nr:DUF2177 family protein [Neotabrizicola shimadae]QYZ68307.1 DUF2177 family protein [Neotabrizicola shimadae]
MTLILLYVVTAVVFLALDAVMLTFVMQPLFASHIGGLMLESPRWGPALVFYAGYVAGLVALVSWPGLREGRAVLVPGAVLGAMAYGTYELTNYAILRDWHVSMVVTDLTWGAVLTGVSAWAGVAIVRALRPGG